MSGLSLSPASGPLSRLEARLLSGTLARKIALVVCTVLATATAVMVEFDYAHDRREETGELEDRVRADALQLAAAIHRGPLTRSAASDVLRAYATGTSSLAHVDLLDGEGRILWSNRSKLNGKMFDASAYAHGRATKDTWFGAAMADGGAAATAPKDDHVAAVVPIHPGGERAHRNVVGRGSLAAVAITWDTTEEAASATRRRVSYHLLGLLTALTLGFLIWQLLAGLVSRPLAHLAQRAGHDRLLSEDLGALVGRDDEVGALTRELIQNQRRLDDRRSQIAERTARLEAVLNASREGIALATQRHGEWQLDHVNEPFAALGSHPAAWYEGRPIRHALGAIEPVVVDPISTGQWIQSSLTQPEFEGMRAVSLRDPERLVEVSTRPVRDEKGRAFGRMWTLRDVTQQRSHEQMLLRQNQELATLDLVARRVSRSLDGRAILASAASTLAEILETPHVRILTDDGKGRLVPLEGPADELAVRWGQSIERQRGALRAGDVIRLDNAIALPVRDASGLVAVVVLGRDGGVAFGDDEAALLRRAIHPVEAAIENARLFTRTESQLVENQTLSEVSRSIGRSEEPELILSDLLRVVCARLGYRNAAILLPDEKSGDLYVRASEGYHTNLAQIRLPVIGPSVTARAFREGTVFNVADVRRFHGYVAGSEDIRSELAIPLRVGERVLGILDIESDRVGAFGDDDERILSAIANQAGMVLSNAWLFAEAKARATRFEAVNEIARAVSSTLDPTRLERAIVSQLARVVPCDRYAILHYDHERRRIERTVVLDARTDLAHDGDGLSWSFDEGLAPTSLSPHRAESFPDLSRAPAMAESGHVAHGLSSMVVVPVALDGVVRVAIVAAAQKPGGFDDDQIRLLEAVSWHVGVALKNAELFSRLQASYIQLNEAQDGLVRSEKLRALGEMASGVAHDFNNVLGAILGRAQLLRMQLASHELGKEIEIIEKAALDGASTVRRLQDFTRVRTDREFQPVSLTQVAQDCLSLTRGRWRDEAERAGLHYDVTTAFDDVPDVAGQASELREVLTNIILNALDAMPHGGSLHLSTGVTRRPGRDEVVLEARDSGEGMSEEVRARIFDPFFTTKGVRGVGLGLSVVYGIVQRHGGRIEVESVSGKGTTMRVVLPAIDGTLAAASAIAAAPAIRVGAAPAVRLRVLVVDDEPNVRTLLADLLRTVGHEVVESACGRDAIQLVDDGERFDVVLTDLGMPDLSGWEVARNLASRDDAPPVILVTGWGIQLDDRTLADSGVSAVVAKPFTIEDVLAVVEQVHRKAA